MNSITVTRDGYSVHILSLSITFIDDRERTCTNNKRDQMPGDLSQGVSSILSFFIGNLLFIRSNLYKILTERERTDEVIRRKARDLSLSHAIQRVLTINESKE